MTDEHTQGSSWTVMCESLGPDSGSNVPTAQTTANHCQGSCPLHCNFHTRQELNTLLFRFLAINQILHFETYFGDSHSSMLGDLVHRGEAGLAPGVQYADIFCHFPSDLGSGLSLSLSSSSSLLISKSFLFAFFCLHERWPQVFLLLFSYCHSPCKTSCPVTQPQYHYWDTSRALGNLYEIPTFTGPCWEPALQRFSLPLGVNTWQAGSPQIREVLSIAP